MEPEAPDPRTLRFQHADAPSLTRAAAAAFAAVAARCVARGRGSAPSAGARAGGAVRARAAEGWPQATLPVRLREEIQAVPRPPGLIAVTPVIHVLVGLIGDGARPLAREPPAARHSHGGLLGVSGRQAAGGRDAAALHCSVSSREELGIDVCTAEPLLEIVHEYPDKTVRLDVWRVLDYRGVPQPKEGQELRWGALAQLEQLQFLPADRPILAALAGFAREDQQSASRKCTS